MGKYDIPAVINYVLTKAGQSTLSYIGHSLGCAMFFVGMITHPELNAKIDVMIALAPATSVAEIKTSLRYQAPFINQLVVCILSFFVQEKFIFVKLQTFYSDSLSSSWRARL